jgi:hypothetical protein
MTVLKQQLLKHYKTFSAEIDRPFGEGSEEVVERRSENNVNLNDIMKAKSIGPEIYNAIVTKKIEALRYLLDYGFMIFCKSLDKSCPVKTFPTTEIRLNSLAIGLLPLMLEMDEKTRDICKSVIITSKGFINDNKLSDMRKDPPYMMRCELSPYEVYLQLLNYKKPIGEFCSNVFLISGLTDHPKP